MSDFIKECLAQLKLRLRLDVAIASELEAQEARIYALEENRKQKDASIKLLHERIGQLEMILKGDKLPAKPAPKISPTVADNFGPGKGPNKNTGY